MKIVVINGHPDPAPQRFAAALAAAYAEGAAEGRHQVRRLAVGDLNLPPLASMAAFSGPPPDQAAAVQETIAWADHLVLIFPLWCGDMPAIMKGFIERILQPGLIRRQGTDQAMNWRIFPGKTARVVMTMGMPTLFYRFWYGANTLRLLKRNILHFIGVKPVRETLFGMAGEVSTDRRLDWLKQMEALGTAAM